MPVITQRMARELTDLCLRHGYDEDHPLSTGNKAIAGLLVGYGVSLSKASGMTLEDTLRTIREHWAGMQGG